MPVVRDLAHEAPGVGGIGGVEYVAALCTDDLGAAVVHVGGGMEPDTRVAVVVVIPGEQSSAVSVRVLEGTEDLGEVRPVLEGPEMAFDVRIVVARMGPAV